MNTVMAASSAEMAAVDLDRSGNNQAAIQKYEESVRQLEAAIAITSSGGDHAEDHPKLVQHRDEVRTRITYLRGLAGKAPTIPVEEQIKAVQIGMQAASSAASAAGQAGGVKTLAACAALGAGAGLMMLGPVGAVAGAVGAGYVATRQDKAGEVARSAGGLGVAAVTKAKEINDQHQISTKVVEAGKHGFAAAKEADTKYGVTTKISSAASTAMAKGREIEQTHHVTDKVASGFSKGLTKLTAVLATTGNAGTASTSGASGSAAPASNART